MINLKLKQKKEEEERKKKEEEKKKKHEEQKTEEEKTEEQKTDEQKRGKKLSNGEIYMKREMPEIEKNLPSNVPQALLIREKDGVMEFEVEYTPDSSTYWFGGKYIFSFQIPKDFPFSAPKVMCKTKIYHPNIDYDGNVCLNILKEDWKPVMTVLTCIAGVYQLFVVPNPNDPLNHEVAKIMRDNISQFKENVKRTLRGGYQFGQQFPNFISY